MSALSDLHNRLAGEIVAAIVKPTIEAGGDHAAVLVLLESVIAGTVVVLAKLGGDEVVLDVLVEGVKARIAELRLKDAPPHGSA